MTRVQGVPTAGRLPQEHKSQYVGTAHDAYQFEAAAQQYGEASTHLHPSSGVTPHAKPQIYSQLRHGHIGTLPLPLEGHRSAYNDANPTHSLARRLDSSTASPLQPPSLTSQAASTQLPTADCDTLAMYIAAMSADVGALTSLPAASAMQQDNVQPLLHQRQNQQAVLPSTTNEASTKSAAQPDTQSEPVKTGAI